MRPFKLTRSMVFAFNGDMNYTPFGNIASTACKSWVLALVCLLPHIVVAGEDQEEYFERHVRPILVERCYSCHAGESQRGGLSLETRAGWEEGGDSGPAIIAGKPQQSLLINAINYGDLQMPPPDEGGRLSADEIEHLTRWVENGAFDPREEIAKLGGMPIDQAKAWWAFQPLKADGSLTSKQLDARLSELYGDLEIAAPADKRTLLRRATYDLTGLPPTMEQVRAFEDDDSADAMATVIERLLRSPAYGVQWGRHWLDVVRYADTAGENTDRPLPHVWRYRNWVIEALNRDMPFSEFTRLQLAGDILRAEAPLDERNEGIVATGYLAVARRFGHDIDNDIHLMYEDVIDNVGKSFLGLTLSCARCHDHKYDSISSEDYYALYGIFASSRFSFPGCEAKGQPRDLIPLIAPDQVEQLNSTYENQLAIRERELKATQDLVEVAQQSLLEATAILVEAQVAEGEVVRLEQLKDDSLKGIELKRGEALQFVVAPNANYGADTTRLELTIRREQDGAEWKSTDVVARFQDGFMLHDRGALWCMLDVTDGFSFLNQQQLNVAEKKELLAWTNGSLPSITVNTSSDPIVAWTRLPGNSLFLHPGDRRSVAITWVCPEDGRYGIDGEVADAHPAPTLDGVGFRIEHLVGAEVGKHLGKLNERAAMKVAPTPERPTIPVAYGVVDAEPKNVRLHQRGDPEQLGEEVPRRWLTIFGGLPTTSQGSGRADLAEWIVEHPLFARVVANRVWQWHFGRGLVESSSDFGGRGQAPSHPELLDELAAFLRAHDYRLKPLHRLIMNSTAYQRSSSVSEATRSRDPDNRQLSYFSRRRLTAEEIRDTLLWVSGQLDLSFAETHPFPPESTWTFTQHAPFYANYDTNRRSAFLMVQRQRRHPYLAIFDGADPNSSTPGRQATTVPTQALYFLNDAFFHGQSAVVAERVLEQPENDRFEYAFQQVFQRSPRTEELQLAQRFIADYPGAPAQRWEAYLRVLLASNEFLYLD